MTFPPATSSPSPPRRQIFISYSRSDLLAVQHLCEDLQKAGHVVWMDVKGIEVGEAWRQELETQISASEALIACISPDFLDSPHCQDEIDQAQRERKPIYPVLVRRLNAGQNTGSLSHLQYIDLTINYPIGLRLLRRQLPRPRLVPRLLARDIAVGGLLLLAVLFFVLIIAAGPQINGFVFGPTPTLTPTPSLETYGVGVAVGYFATEPDAAIQTDEADLMVERFGRLLEQELADYARRVGTRITYGYLGPAVIGRITDEEEARQKAVDYAADIVVYGTIERTRAGQVEIQPQFYINPRTHPGMHEMTGSYRFGSPIRVSTLDSGVSQDELTARTQALADVVDGLAQFSNDNFDGALTAFGATSDVPGWDEMTGREVVNILTGNVYLGLAGQATLHCERNTVLENVDAAIAQFEAASALTNESDDVRDYGRPYAGLAAARYLQARWLPPENDGCDDELIDASPLRAGLDDMEQARRIYARDATASEPVVKARMWAIEANLQYTICILEPGGGFSDEEMGDACAQTRAIAQQIIDLYEDSHDPTVASLAGEAHGIQGDLDQLLDGDFYAAIDAYDAALAIDGIYPEHRMLYTRFKGDAYFHLDQFSQAATLYDAARQIAEELSLDAHAEYYRALRDLANDNL
ncbi:MAG: toll/interleukin-1 receptor domain-containing protein [Anaerolineae bacterium]|nr:toll/interleukin-1 receptor domain-containing protein [Anaerolineae bacterium]